MVKQFETLRESLESADLQALRTNFVTLGDKLASVPSVNLSPEMTDLWHELAMLLQNDSVEGRDVQTMRDADRVFAVTRRHIEQLKNQFALSVDDAEPAVEVLDAPQGVVAQIEQLVPIYLSISEALAADESEQAKQSVSKLHDWIATTSAVEGSGKAIERWTKERRDLSEITAKLSKANDLETLRSSFALLSEQMLSLQRMFGLPASQALYEIHCPMTFDGRGASWIQSDDAVKNPYYGASMLKCADRIEKLEAKSASK